MRAPFDDEQAKVISPEGEKDFGSYEKQSSPRTESLEQNFTNRLAAGQRDQLEGPSENALADNRCLAWEESGYESLSKSFAKATSRYDGITEAHSDIDWNGWFDWLSKCQSLQKASLWICEAIDHVKKSLDISSKDAEEFLDRVLRKGRATGHRPLPAILNQLLNEEINSKRPTS